MVYGCVWNPQVILTECDIHLVVRTLVADVIWKRTPDTVNTKILFIYIDAPFRIPSEANMGGVYCVTQHTYKYFAITPYISSIKETNILPCLHTDRLMLVVVVVIVVVVFVFTFCHHCVYIHNPPIIYINIYIWQISFLVLFFCFISFCSYTFCLMAYINMILWLLLN